MEAVILIAQSAAESNGVLHTVLTYVPLPIFMLILAPVVYVMVRAGRQYSELLKRSLLHMDRLEAKNDEIIGLLKEIRDNP
jgi:large-conductance mechanosensitive channel